MNIKRLIASTAVLAMTASLLTGCGSDSNSSAAETTTDSKTVNIAIQPSAAFIPIYIVKEKGWLEEALAEQGVEVTWNSFESGPPMNESLAAGSSDVGFMGDVPSVSAIAAGQQTEFVAIACDAPDSYAMLVAADSDITSPADLKDKTVGTTVGSSGHNLTDKLLKEHGLDINSDIQLANISTGDAATVLSSGEVDAVAIWEPTITRLVDNGTAKIIGEGSDCNMLGVNPIVARTEYAENNPEVIKTIIEQYARGVAELENLDEETTNAIAEIFALEPEQLMTISEKYQYNVVFSPEDTESLQDTISFLVNIGNLSEEFDISSYVNTEYVDSLDLSDYLG